MRQLSTCEEALVLEFLDDIFEEEALIPRTARYRFFSTLVALYECLSPNEAENWPSEWGGRPC